MMPLDVDVVAILADLNNWGWRDQKIEVILGYSGGYCAKMRDGPRPGRPYQQVARLYNLWAAESATRQTLVYASTESSSKMRAWTNAPQT